MNVNLARTLPLVAAALAGAAGGYLLGFGGGRAAARTSEAAADLLVPVLDFRVTRVRREAIRSELRDMMQRQLASQADSGVFLPDRLLADGSAGFVLHTFTHTYGPTVLGGRGSTVGWIATLSHERSPAREACSVALGVDRAYAGGIPLRGPGKVRCSWDLATRLNRLW